MRYITFDEQSLLDISFPIRLFLVKYIIKNDRIQYKYDNNLRKRQLFKAIDYQTIKQTLNG
jgi:hypothetical protein